MDVKHKVSFTPGEEPVSFLIIPPAGVAPFFLPDSTQTELQALAPAGQPWADDESRAVAQALLDADPRSSLFGGMTIVNSEPTPEG